MGTRKLGRLIMIKIGDKYFAGTTDISYKSTAAVEESLIKEDGGKPQKEIDRIDREISINGIIQVNDTGEATTHTDWKLIRAAMEAKTALAFTYGELTAGAPQIAGNLLLTAYNENSGSSGYGTWDATATILDDDSLSFADTSA